MIFQAGGERFALDSSRVAEVAGLAHFKKVPHAPDYVAGLFSYRGKVIPAVDLSALLGGGPAGPLLSTRLLVVRLGGKLERRLGLVAEKATESLYLQESDFEEPGLSMERAPYLGGVARDSRGMIQHLDIERVLPEEVREALYQGEAD